MKTTLTRFKMQKRDDSNDIICVAADNEKRAYDNISGGETDWKCVGSEEVPYVHAPIVKAVCVALGKGWTAKAQSYEHPESSWVLENDGLKLYFAPPAYHHKGAWQVSLHAGRSKGQAYVTVYDEKNNRVSYPSVNIGATKTPEQIAKDITRRLLPDALKVNAMVNATIERENNYANTQVETLKAVCEAFGVAVPKDHYSKEPVFSGYAGEVDFDVSGDKVTLKLRSVTLDTAKKIAAALR